MDPSQVLALRPTITDYHDLQQQFELKKQLAASELQKQALGQNAPAALQLANEYQKRISAGDVNGANLIMQFAKTQDKGIGFTVDPTTGQQMFAPLQGYAPAVGTIEATKAGMKQDATNQSDVGYKPLIETGTQTAKNNADIAAAAPLAQSKKIGETLGDRSGNYTKAQSALVSFKQQSDIVQKNITDARALIAEHPNLSTGYGQMFANVPNSKSGQLNNYLATIKANVGFDRLQTMRENSPTGGALGSVSENENALLQAVNGALDAKQTDNLDTNLSVIQDLYPKVLEEKNRAFTQDYGSSTPTGQEQSTEQQILSQYPQAKRAPDGKYYVKTDKGYFRID